MTSIPGSNSTDLILNLAHHKGYKVGEIEIEHFPRKYGKTGCESSRLILNPLDMDSLELQLTFMEHPMDLFGLTDIDLLTRVFIFGIEVIILNLVYGHAFSRIF